MIDIHKDENLLCLNYWLVKTEPETYSIDQLEQDHETVWDGVRNFEARNNLLKMKKNDRVFIYHSGRNERGIVGLAKVIQTSFPDETAFLTESIYYDAHSKRNAPRWFAVKLGFLEKYSKILHLQRMKKIKQLNHFRLLKRGCRLSVMPVNDQVKNILLDLQRSMS